MTRGVTNIGHAPPPDWGYDGENASVHNGGGLSPAGVDRIGLEPSPRTSRQRYGGSAGCGSPQRGRGGCLGRVVLTQAPDAMLCADPLRGVSPTFRLVRRGDGGRGRQLVLPPGRPRMAVGVWPSMAGGYGD
jgi:hypothetical protein